MDTQDIPPADSLLLGRDARGYFVRASGSIRAMLCFPLREEILSRLEGPSDIPAIYADLSGCRYMDSTFIGLLVAMDKRLQRASGGRLHVVAPSAESRETLTQIGLQNILLIEEHAPAFPEEMNEVGGEKAKPGADFILSAHEALIETSEEARKKFGLLKEMLERKLKAEKPPKENPEG
jgi:anti-anti-sigma factor